MSENETYKLVYRADSDFYSVHLLEGKYKDVIYTYGKVSIGEERDDGRLPLKFKWKLEFQPEELDEDLDSSEEFQNYIGDLLTELILESKSAGKNTDNNIEDTGSE